MSQKIAFFCNVVCSEYQLLARLLGQIRSLYETEQILILADGPENHAPLLDDVVAPYQGVTILSRPERLKVANRVHEHSYDNFRQMLTASPAAAFIKLDPDSYLRARLPKVNRPWCGQPFKSPPGYWWHSVPGMHGGCWGMQRSLVAKLVKVNPFDPIHYGHGMRYHKGRWESTEDIGLGRSVERVCPWWRHGNWSKHLRLCNGGTCVPPAKCVSHPNDRLHLPKTINGRPWPDEFRQGRG